jgi:nucleoside-diphosphate-sugar epimerase
MAVSRWKDRAGEGIMRPTVIVAGASGLIGVTALRHFAQDVGWQVIGLSRRPPVIDIPRARHISVDLSNRAAVAAAMSALSAATHLVYAAVEENQADVEAGWTSRDQMGRNRDMLANLVDALCEGAPGLRHVSVMHGQKAYGGWMDRDHAVTDCREDLPRHNHENFYWLQEDYIRARQAGQGWHYTFWRPALVFGGDTVTGNLNALLALAAYAALCRAAGEALDFPGAERTSVVTAIDTDIIGEALLWATESPAARNETFNLSNGDVFSYRDVWPVLAEAFGVPLGRDRAFTLAAEMARLAPVWARLVAEQQLAAPADLASFLGGSISMTDLCLASDLREALSTVRLRKAGFGACAATVDVMRKWIGRYHELKLLPSFG